MEKARNIVPESSKMFKRLLKSIALDDISMIFFQFFKILIFWVVIGVKGQRMVQNDKTFCLPHFISKDHASSKDNTEFYLGISHERHLVMRTLQLRGFGDGGAVSPLSPYLTTSRFAYMKHLFC